jgi:hypothetical protein
VAIMAINPTKAKRRNIFSLLFEFSNFSFQHEFFVTRSLYAPPVYL